MKKPVRINFSIRQIIKDIMPYMSIVAVVLCIIILICLCRIHTEIKDIRSEIDDVEYSIVQDVEEVLDGYF